MKIQLKINKQVEYPLGIKPELKKTVNVQVKSTYTCGIKREVKSLMRI